MSTAVSIIHEIVWGLAVFGVWAPGSLMLGGVMTRILEPDENWQGNIMMVVAAAFVASLMFVVMS